MYGCHCRVCFQYTVFIQIVATATINFSRAGVRLLIKGGSYSRVAFINFGATPLGDIDTVDSFFRTDIRIFKLYDREISSKTKPRTFLPCFCLELMIVRGLQSWPHPLNCVRACVRLLFKGGYYFFRRAPCAATI